MGYPWPASKLTRGDMIKLCELRKQTRRPLTRLLHEAIDAYYRLLSKAPPSQGAESPSADNPGPTEKEEGTVSPCHL